MGVGKEGGICMVYLRCVTEVIDQTWMEDVWWEDIALPIYSSVQGQRLVWEPKYEG